MHSLAQAPNVLHSSASVESQQEMALFMIAWVGPQGKHVQHLARPGIMVIQGLLHVKVPTLSLVKLLSAQL